MVERVLIGNHPLAAGSGMYATKDGFDVTSADPDNAAHRARFALNTRGGKMANVLQAGTCTQGARVAHASIGAIPFVLYHRLFANGGFNPHEIACNLDSTLTPSACENLSKWRISQSTTGFTILTREANVPDPTTGATFRYIVFNLPVD
jgi:hypothetical protein